MRFRKKVIYAGSYDGTVYALNSATGAVKWKFSTGQGRIWSPAVVDGQLYVTAQGATVGGPSFAYALNAQTGAKIWSYEAKDTIFTEPSVENGSIYFGSLQGRLYNLNAATGALRWSQNLGQQFSNMAIGKLLYSTNSDGNLYAFDLLTGAVVWKSAVTGVASPPTIAHGMVYASSGDGYFDAFSADTGAKVWSVNTNDVAYGVVAANGTVYFPSQNVLHAYTAQSPSVGAEIGKIRGLTLPIRKPTTHP